MKPSKGIVYYTDGNVDFSIHQAVRRQLQRANLPTVSVTIKEPRNDFGLWVRLPLERGYLTMFKQILEGLETNPSDLIFFCEHDVLYHQSHFEFTPPTNDKIYYNQNVWKVDASSGHALHYKCSQTSGICASRQLLLDHYRKRVEQVERIGFSRKMGFEPGTHNRPERVDDLTSDTWMSEFPNIDIRHSTNLTESRWTKEQFRNQRYTEGWTESDAVHGWGKTEGRFQQFLKDLS